MASEEELSFNQPHAPHPNAIEAFSIALHTIKATLVKNRHDWDKHEPRMWARASHLTDHQLTDFHPDKDLVLVSSSPTSYGTILLGKLRIPAINDNLGEGFIHVRLHDPPNRGDQDVVFHSIWHDAGKPNAEGHPTVWKAIQTKDEPLVFFNE